MGTLPALGAADPGIAILGAVLTAVLVVATITSLVVAGRMSRLARDAQDAAREAEQARRHEAEQRTLAEAARRQAEASAREAGAQRERAEAGFATARKAVDRSFTQVSESKLLNVPGLRTLRAELLGSALAFYEGFLKERGADPALTVELLRTRLKVARVLEELGQGEKARAACEAALAGFEKALLERPDDPDLKDGLAEAVVGTAGGENDVFVARHRRAIALREEVLKARPGDLVNKRKLAESYNGLAFFLSGANSMSRAISVDSLAAFERCATLQLELAEAIPDDPDLFSGLAQTFNNLAAASQRGNQDRPGIQSLALCQRALEFVREALRLRPHDASTATGLMILSGHVASGLMGMWRKEEAVAVTRASVETLRTLAQANPEAPAIQDAYLRASLHHAEVLTNEYKTDEAGDRARCVDEAVHTLTRPVGAFDRLSRETGEDFAGVADLQLGFARRLTRIKIDLTPEQKAARDLLVDRAVENYREAVARGLALDLDADRSVFLAAPVRLREESLLKDHPGFAALAAQVKAGAGKVAVAGTAATTAEPPHVSPPGPKVDVRLARASLLSALGLARVEVKDAKGEEALATLGRSRALFDELARERPGDPEVERDRDQVVLNLWTALDELARSSLQAGRPAEAAGYRTRASDRAAETAGALSRNLAVIPRTSRVFYWLTPTVSMLEETHVANDAVFNELARLRPRDPFVYVCRADALAHRGDWAGAAAAMKTLLALDPDNYTYWYVASAGFPHAGDVESYRRVCREMLDRFERSGDPDVAMWSALACLTLPDAVDDYSAPAERAARALRAVRARGSGLADLYPIYFDIAAAGVDYRAGRFEAAVKRLSARNYELPVNRGVFGATSHMILATAYHRLGRAAEARRELNMTSEVLRVHPESAKWEVPPLGVWDDWLRYNILRREAEALILDPDFPADPFAI